MKMHIYVYKYNLEACKLEVDSIDSFEEIIFFEKKENFGCFINDLNSFFGGKLLYSTKRRE